MQATAKINLILLVTLSEKTDFKFTTRYITKTAAITVPKNLTRLGSSGAAV